jgi:hypothetical protein
MKHYAVLDRDSIVTNIIVATSLQVAESVTFSDCVLVPIGTTVHIGWSYVDGVFVNPNPPEIHEEEPPVEETPA